MESAIKVIVVDDEEITRKFIRQCIDWDSLGMEVVAEAAGGSEALDLVEQCRPDVVFTDIQMPFMDGLELGRALSEQYPQTKIVIITAHKDFEYAKSGIEIGISDYLLKPVDRKKLYALAEVLSRQIQEDRLHWTEYGWLKTQLEENRVHLREKVLNELLDGTGGGEETKSRFAYYFPEKCFRKVQVALVAVHPAGGSSTTNEEEQLALRLRVLHTARRMLAHTQMEAFFGNSQHIVLFSFSSKDSLPQACEALRDTVLKAVHCMMYIGVGNSYERLEQADKSYREALDALRYGYAAQANQPVFYNEELSVDRRQWSVSSEDLAEVTFLVKASLTEKAAALVAGLLAEAQEQSASFNQLRIAGVNIATSILNALGELGLSSESLAEKELPYRAIYESVSSESIRVSIAQILEQAAQAIQHSRQKKGTKLVEGVKEYIQEHLSEPSLTLTQIAGEFYTNQSYLSRLFKRETGMSFTDYLTRARMEKAITLLNTSEMKAYQIAEKIGISDAYYFSNCFKKYTGKTVSEYRKG